MMTQPTPGFGVYPVFCRFPLCDRPAPLADGDEISLCADHERLRFYAPNEFARVWREPTLGR